MNDKDLMVRIQTFSKRFDTPNLASPEGRLVKFDVFFSLSHTKVGDTLPTEAQMFQNFFDQVEAADALGSVSYTHLTLPTKA